MCNGSLAAAVIITGAAATDDDGADETAGTIDSFNSYSTGPSDGEVGGGGGHKGVGGRLEAALFHAILFRVLYQSLNVLSLLLKPLPQILVFTLGIIQTIHPLL